MNKDRPGFSTTSIFPNFKPAVSPEFSWLFGLGKEMKRLELEIQRAAKSQSYVLIVGETGSGKEVVARILHDLRRKNFDLSPAETPFVAVNCGTVPEALAESILFGHERGAFTSARDRQLGKFELARSGTIFLDELQSLSMQNQTRLLRVLQTREFERLGSKSTIPMLCSLVAACNIPLELLVERRQFRKDLFYRLNIETIYLPALRYRREDLPHLIKIFLAKAQPRSTPRVQEISQEVFEIFLSYSWPGNIRELENVLAYACARADGLIERAHLPPQLTGALAHYLENGDWFLPPN